MSAPRCKAERFDLAAFAFEEPAGFEWYGDAGFAVAVHSLAAVDRYVDATRRHGHIGLVFSAEIEDDMCKILARFGVFVQERGELDRIREIARDWQSDPGEAKHCYKALREICDVLDGEGGA